jgi:hypothetical protein
MVALPTLATRTVFLTVAFLAITLVGTSTNSAQAVLAEEESEGGVGVSSDQGDAARVTRDIVPRFARSSYVWPFESGPYYGDVDRKRRHAAGTLITPVGSFRLTEGPLRLPAQLRSSDNPGRSTARYFIVQLSREAVKAGSLDELRDVLLRSGSRIADYMSVNAYVTKLNSATLGAAREIPGVLAVEPYHAAFKLSPRLGRTPHVDAEKA